MQMGKRVIQKQNKSYHMLNPPPVLKLVHQSWHDQSPVLSLPFPSTPTSTDFVAGAVHLLDVPWEVMIDQLPMSGLYLESQPEYGIGTRRQVLLTPRITSAKCKQSWPFRLPSSLTYAFKFSPKFDVSVS